MNTKIRKKITESFESLKHFYFKNGRRELDFDDRPLANFLDLLYPFVFKNEYYNDYIFISSVTLYLERLEDEFSKEEFILDELIESIINNFNKNKEKHYLIFPLQGSGLKKDISFSRFNFLIKKSQDDLINQISSITSIELQHVKDSIEHTKNSRSRDFLKSSIVIIEIENQTENIRYSALQVAQYVVNFLYLIHSAFGIKSSIFRTADTMMEENRHVAILSKDGWRCGHGFSWDAYLQCKLDLDFMEEQKYQDIFINLFDCFAMNKNMDELGYKFKNSFLLYSRGYIQSKVHHDNSLALLLFITSLEALITEGKQEKRIRLAAVIPRLISIDGYNQSELANIINKLYHNRNDFVHAGQTPYFHYEDNKLEILDRLTALLILKYIEMDALLQLENGQTRVNSWNKHLDNIFTSIIFG